MPSSIPQWIFDNVFPELSTLSPQLLKFRSKHRFASSCSKAPRPQCPPTLPSELLQIIFTEAMRSSVSESDIDIDLHEKIVLRSTILACAQVCQLWRHAARGYSPLWVHAVDVQAHSPHVVRDLLQLSRPHPIVVGHGLAPFRVSTARDFAVLYLLKEDRHRIQEWNVDILDTSLPIESCCWIFGVPGAAEVLPAHTLRLTGNFPASSDILQELAPPLRRLRLADTNLNLSPRMNFSNLTELSVSGVESPSTKRLLVDWLGLLRGTPRLQFLGFTDAIGPGPRIDPVPLFVPGGPVELAHLRLLSVAESNWVSTSQVLNLLVSPYIQKPDDCGLNLTLPSAADFPDDGSTLHNVMGVLGFIAVRHLPLHPTTFVSPRLEMALKAHSSGFQFSLGTILDPETLNWNGERGTKGVHDYLDDYFATPACASPRPPRHPPLSITIRNPNTQDIIHACILNNHLFSTAKSLCIAVEPRLCQSMDVYPILDAIPSILARMREVETVTLDEGALVAVLPMLRGHMPALRNLRYMAIESPTSEVGSYHDMSGVATRSIVRQYVRWRARVGRPVHALGCGPMRGEEQGNLTSGKWKRQGVVAIPL